MEHIKYKYNKPWYPQDEALELFGISDSRLRRFMAQLNSEGKSTAEMGRFFIKGVKTPFFEPNKLQSFLEGYAYVQTSYDYDKEVDSEARKLKVVSNNTNKKEARHGT